MNMEETMITRNDVAVGMLVRIIPSESKNDALVTGYIAKILTKKATAKQVKVELTSGIQGVVDELVSQDAFEREKFRFYNLFFFDKHIYSIWDKKRKRYLVLMIPNEKKQRQERTAFLFNDEAAAKKMLASLADDTFMLRELNRKKPIPANFKTLTIEFFRINEERKLSFKKLTEMEQFYKNMH